MLFHLFKGEAIFFFIFGDAWIKKSLGTAVMYYIILILLFINKYLGGSS